MAYPPFTPFKCNKPLEVKLVSTSRSNLTIDILYFSAPVITLTARQEIVVSAGTFGTPALLQLSGIGNKKDLAALGITTIVNNPSVGMNMSDHALVANPFLVNNNNTFDSIFRTPSILAADLAQWQANQTGPLADGVCNQLGWLRLPSNSSIFNTIPDPAAGPNASHYELIFSVSVASLPVSHVSGKVLSLC